MDKGKAAEYNHPYLLLVKIPGDTTITNIGGLFSQMVLSTGLENAQVLFGIAEASYYKSNSNFEPEPAVKHKDTFIIQDRRTGRKYEVGLKDGQPLQSDLNLIKETLPKSCVEREIVA